MAPKLPFLQSVGGSYAQFLDAVEADAKDFIQKDLAAANEHRINTFSAAKKRVADVRTSVAGVTKMLDEIDAALEGSNSGARPTSGGSQSSPGNGVTTVSANPSENAHLAQVK